MDFLFAVVAAVLLGSTALLVHVCGRLRKGKQGRS